MDEKKRILVLAGPTGSGESTITNAIIERYPIFKRLVTATSRNPRGNEKDRIDYYFFSKEDFEKEIANGNMLEHTYIENRDTYYGTYRPELEKKLAEGSNIIVNVDIIGAKYYKDNYQATAIFIVPDSIDNLRKRLIKRNLDISQDELEKRMTNAKNEIEEEGPYYDYTVVNGEGELERAIKEVASILQKENYELG